MEGREATQQTEDSTNTAQLPGHLEESTISSSTISLPDCTNSGLKNDIQANLPSSQQDLRRSLRQANLTSKPTYTMVARIDPPAELEFPHGTKDGVRVSPCQILGAGKGLFEIRPDPHNSSHL
jgi:hypothetical protein